jgi:hypothetical protein
MFKYEIEIEKKNINTYVYILKYCIHRQQIKIGKKIQFMKNILYVLFFFNFFSFFCLTKYRHRQ